MDHCFSGGRNTRRTNIRFALLAFLKCFRAPGTAQMSSLSASLREGMPDDRQQSTRKRRTRDAVRWKRGEGKTHLPKNRCKYFWETFSRRKATRVSVGSLVL